MFRFPGIPLLVLVLACPASAAPIGMVSSLNGKAEQRSVGATEWKHLRLMTRLEAGDAIRCEAGGDAVVTLFASQHPSLTVKTLADLFLIATEHLDCHLASQVFVHAKIDRTHAAPAEQRDHLVTLGFHRRFSQDAAE